jgi:hypothetical protein
MDVLSNDFISFYQITTKRKFRGIWVKQNGSKIWVDGGLPGRSEGPLAPMSLSSYPVSIAK